MSKKPNRIDVELAAMRENVGEDGEELSLEEQEALQQEDQPQLIPDEAQQPEQEVVAPVKAPEVEAKSETPEAKAAEAPQAEATKDEAKATDDEQHPINKRIRQLVDERKAAEKEAQEFRERFARADARAQYIREQEEARERAAQELRDQQRRLSERPDETIDPIGAQVWDLKEQTRVANERLAALQNEVQARFNQTQVDTEITRFQSAFASDVKAAQIKYPDYMDAAKYATEQQMKIWMSTGQYNEQQAYELVNAQAAAIAKNAIDNGQSPTDIFYGYAKQLGWSGPVGTNGAKPVGQVPSNGGVTPREKLNQISEGQKATGFGKTSNASETDAVDIAHMSAADLGRMSDDTFNFYANNPDVRVRTAFHKRVQMLELGE